MLSSAVNDGGLSNSPNRPLARVGILGEVAVWDDAGVVVQLSPQLRRLLALLITADGASVSIDRIADHITGGRLDGSVIRTAISRLRRILGDRVEKTSAGYRLQLGPDELDSWRFSELMIRSVDAPPLARLAALTDALAMWRGPALEGMADEPWAVATATRLDERSAQLPSKIAPRLWQLAAVPRRRSHSWAD